jgi:hypothetical protein
LSIEQCDWQTVTKIQALVDNQDDSFPCFGVITCSTSLYYWYVLYGIVVWVIWCYLAGLIGV